MAQPVGKQANVGLRERKKQECRRRIASEAERLFRKHGFENVRMADIATAADVSEPTLYNYFPTKEHLVFDMDQEFEGRVVRCVADGLAQGNCGEAILTEALKLLDELCAGAGKDTGIPASVQVSPALHRVWLQIQMRIAERVAETWREFEGKTASRVKARIMGRAVAGVFGVLMEEFGKGSLEGKPAKRLRRELGQAAEETIRLLFAGTEHRARRRA